MNRDDSALLPPPEGPQRKNLGKVIYLGFIFMFLFAAYNSAQNLVSQIFKQLGYNVLGQINLFTVYGVMGIANLFISGLKQRISYKLGFILGSTGYILFLCSGALATECSENQDASYCATWVIYFVNIFSSVVLGCSAALLWVCQGSYVAKCATDETKGLFTGVFWALMQMSQAIGNLASAVLISSWGQLTYYVVMSGLAIAASCLFLFLPNLNEEKKVNDVNAASLASQPSVSENWREVKKCLKDPTVYPLYAMMFLSGVVIAFYAGFLYEIIENSLASDLSNEEVNMKTALVFLALGACEGISGLIVGRLLDKYNKVLVANFTNILIEIALVLSLLAVYEQNYTLCFIVGGAWGLCDNGTMTTIGTIIATEYNNKLELFALFRLWQGFGAVVGFVVAILVQGQPLYVFILVVAVFQIATNIYMNTFKLKVHSIKESEI